MEDYGMRKGGYGRLWTGKGDVDDLEVRMRPMTLGSDAHGNFIERGTEMSM
jgi:hypothetical protein